MSKTERLARRLFELTERFGIKDPKHRITLDQAQSCEHNQWLHVARGLLRDQARERKEKAK